MVLKDICALFIHTCTVTRKLSAHTIRAYTKDLSLFRSTVGEDTKVTAIDRKDITAFVECLCETPACMSSNKRRIACVKAMFRWMELEDHISVNPFHKIQLKLKIPRRLPRNIPNAELTMLIKTARLALGLEVPSGEQKQCPTPQPGYGYSDLSPLISSKRDLNKLTTIVMLELLISTGIRVGELVAIKQDHI